MFNHPFGVGDRISLTGNTSLPPEPPDCKLPTATFHATPRQVTANKAVPGHRTPKRAQRPRMDINQGTARTSDLQTADRPTIAGDDSGPRRASNN